MKANLSVDALCMGRRTLFTSLALVLSSIVACDDLDPGDPEEVDAANDDDLDLAAGTSPPTESISNADADLCATVARKANFQGQALVTAVAVALAESGCDPKATHDNPPTNGCPNGSTDRGLWQINSCYHKEVPVDCAMEAQCNANAALVISDEGTNWKPWATYNNDAYKSKLAMAQAAVNRLPPLAPPPPPPPPPHRTPQSTTRDYNGDGRDDLFWYQPGNGADPLWLGAAGHSFTKTYAPNVTGLYFTVAGDFNADGKADVLFYAPGTNPEAIWNGQADGSFAKSTPKHADGSIFNVNGDYTPLAGDFDGDGHDDVLWYAPGEAADVLWYGLGGNKFSSVSVAVNGTYVPVAGDFDGDHLTDILWYGGSDAYESVWYGNKSHSLGFDKLTVPKVNGLYLPVAGDFDGDGDDDIFWYAPGDAQDNLWLGAPSRVFSHTQPLTPDGTLWNVHGDFEPIPGDFDHNGLTDIFWYGPGADSDSVWYATGKSHFESAAVTVDGTYAPV